MSQYVNRNRKRRPGRRRRIKKSFLLFAGLCVVLVAAAVFVSVKYIFGNNVPVDASSSSSVSNASGGEQVSSGNSESTPSSTSSVFAPDTSKMPESSSISYASINVAPGFETSPLGGNYIDVGNKYVCEVITWEAETFDGKTKDDNSKPTNTPLPVGTVDYCYGTVFDNGKGRNDTTYRNWATLRSGKRIYHESLKRQRSKIYNVSDYGTLPETNNVRIASGGVSSDGRYTVLKLAVDWKAPFTLDLLPQNYHSTSNSSRDYTVDTVTYTYVDITFCYSAKTEIGDVTNLNLDGTIFKSAEWKKNASDYTLRLYLKKTGGFYGWYAEYDSAGNLVFNFLNPKKVTTDANGNVNFNGARIYIDVGHGGMDSGASGGGYNESERNLALAKALEKRLKEMGATVIMSRTGDTYMEAYDSMQRLRDAKADFAVCIHHDSESGGHSSGFSAFHYSVFSSLAAVDIRNATAAAGLYSNVNRVKWHYYFTARVAYCPTVLTENGFMSSSTDLKVIGDNNKLSARANALANGIATYFKRNG